MTWMYEKDTSRFLPDLGLLPLVLADVLLGSGRECMLMFGQCILTICSLADYVCCVCVYE